MLDQLDGRLPVQENVAPMPPVGTAPAPPSSVQQGNFDETNAINYGLNNDANIPDGNGDGSSNGDSPTPAGSNSGAVVGVKVGNTIGQLQELCVHEGHPMPVYDLGSIDGQPHQRNFKMSVRVGGMACHGEGTSKKDAKRDAALKMMARINEEKKNGGSGKKKDKDTASNVSKDSGHASGASGDELYLPSVEDEELASKLSGLKIDSLNQKHLAKIQSFYTQLNESRSRQLLGHG